MAKPRKVKTPKYYYHLTQENWGGEVVLKPRGDGTNRDINEPKTERICVSASIEGCFVAIYIDELKRFNVYRTKRRVRAAKPIKIPDSHITEEFWLDKTTRFIRIGKIKRAEISEVIASSHRRPGEYLGDGKKSTEKWQREAKKKIRKILAEKFQHVQTDQ